ncbi:glycosyltransferase family 2 protein [Candidatus Kaiserbacteria bacterium]|nr:glycosyltransferase family 2 protein [Candidatus Kaiserbacteria bacterium]
MRPELSIVIPAYNEGEHLAAVAVELTDVLRSALLDYEIVVVNNGSRDNTGDIIEQLAKGNPRIRAVHLAENRKYSGGILAGLAEAKGEVMGWAHADGQADPRDIVRLYRAMREGKCELGKAIRRERHESPWRIVQGKIWYGIFQLLFWSPYRDVNATPKLMTRRAAEILKLDSRDWFLDPEFVIKALRNKIPICEVETVWRSRKSGSTRAHLFTGLEFLKNLLLYRIGAR